MPSLSHELLRAHSISWCNVGPVSADGGVSMMTIEDCREFYAREVKFAASATTPGLVEAFAKVPREKFLGPGPWQIGSAEGRAMSAAGLGQLSYTTVEDPRDVYHNVLISLDRAKDINNAQPGSLACWIDALRLKPGERVYHLGCGVGYYTAIMAEVVGPSGSVIDRKSTRLNSSHSQISYAAFCLEKKKKQTSKKAAAEGKGHESIIRVPSACLGCTIGGVLQRNQSGFTDWSHFDAE